MSIILKGIDIPDKENRMYMMELYADGHCSVAKIEDGKCYELTIPSETEAIQIDRPHGRLIDGDKMLKEYKQWLESVPYINNTMSEMGQRIVLIDICHDLEYSAPTILEAEE